MKSPEPELEARSRDLVEFGARPRNDVRRRPSPAAIGRKTDDIVAGEHASRCLDRDPLIGIGTVEPVADGGEGAVPERRRLEVIGGRQAFFGPPEISGDHRALEFPGPAEVAGPGRPGRSVRGLERLGDDEQGDQLAGVKTRQPGKITVAAACLRPEIFVEDASLQVFDGHGRACLSQLGAPIQAPSQGRNARGVGSGR